MLITFLLNISFNFDRGLKKIFERHIGNKSRFTSDKTSLKDANGHVLALKLFSIHIGWC